jgi:CheY-like chemotaxis protein
MLKNNREMDERLDLLLVDSANDDRRFRAAALRAHPGVRVKEVSTGRGAVASLTRGAFQALICANQLPDLHVSALTRMVRAGVCGHPHLPIITVTDAPSVHALGRMDTNAYFIRDTSPDDFANRVLNIVRAAPKTSLLLVEDDPIHAEATATLLTRYYRVDQARSGTAALAEWRAKRHDVILLDLMLPEVSGEEVQRQVLSERHDQIIVILTANSDSDKHPAMVFSGAETGRFGQRYADDRVDIACQGV